jgi:hypothetical protein
VAGIIGIHNPLYIPTIPGVYNRVNDDHKLDTAKTCGDQRLIQPLVLLGKQVLVLGKQAGRTERVSSSGCEHRRRYDTCVVGIIGGDGAGYGVVIVRAIV